MEAIVLKLLGIFYWRCYIVFAIVHFMLIDIYNSM